MGGRNGSTLSAASATLWESLGSTSSPIFLRFSVLQRDHGEAIDLFYNSRPTLGWESTPSIPPACWNIVIQTKERAFSQSFRSLLLTRLEEARTDILYYLEGAGWDGAEKGDGAGWWKGAGYIVGVFRETFEYVGQMGCLLRMQQQQQAIEAFLQAG